MAEQSTAEQSGKRARPTNRSPSHPAFDLAEAVDRAREFYARERFNFAPKHAAMRHWGYSGTSSSGIRALAALLHYGLLDEEGSSEARRVRLSDLGRRIVLDTRPGSRELDAALREAALRPALFRELWERWGRHLPSDVSMEYDLVREYGFNPDSVREFIKNFRATVEFAKLADTDKIPEGDGGKGRPDERGGNEAGDGRAPPPPPPPQGRAMPEVQRQNAQPWDLTIPLIGGGQAILRTPIPLSEADYDLLTNTLQVMLTNMKPAITVAAPPPSPPAGRTGTDE